MAALILTGAVIAHVFVRTAGKEGAIDAMTLGEVDLNWAREHHSLWAEAEIGKLEARARRTGSRGAAAE